MRPPHRPTRQRHRKHQIVMLPLPPCPIPRIPLRRHLHPHLRHLPHQRRPQRQLRRYLQLPVLQHHLQPRDQVPLRHPPISLRLRLRLPARHHHRHHLSSHPRPQQQFHHRPPHARRIHRHPALPRPPQPPRHPPHPVH